MRRPTIRFGSVLCATLLLALTTSSAAQLPRLDELMRQKLEHGQNLFEAVVLADHVSVERYAYELTLLSEASTWTPLRTHQYLSYASTFRDAAASLQEAARDRDQDKVSSAYMELVASCVQCHQHVRGAGRAD
jgi:hypothetical protein